MIRLTPGMQQYMKIKNENPDCIILFRMGDFYETFFEDAKIVARELEITLTARGKGETRAPLAGIPYHAIDPYIAKLVKKGYKVGIVEQTEDPKKAKGLVKRDLIRIITPGTVFESLILDQEANNYILSLIKNKEMFGIGFCDISTGEFLTTEIHEENILNELERLNPAEIIFPMSLEESEFIGKLKRQDFIVNSYDDRFFYHEKALDTLKQHFRVLNMEGFGIRSELMLNSCGALLSYIKETQKSALEHINRLKEYKLEDYMFLDNATIRNLELLKDIMGKENSSLLTVLDKTITPMGKRLIKKWLVSPLVDKKAIEKRLDSVEELKEKIVLRAELRDSLQKIYDIERLIGRVSFGNANPKDLISLKQSLFFIPRMKKLLEETETEELKEISKIPDLRTAEEIIEKGIKEEPNTVIREGNIIKEGYNQELDELREVTRNVKRYLAELEEKEREKTGIKSLKIRYNKIFGYYIEVTKANLHLVPSYYIRKQTQVNSERFITEELKEKESKILGAQERIFELEYELFIDILNKLKSYIDKIQVTAIKIAKLDCFISFAQIAQHNNFCKPRLNSDGILRIEEGRHPVIEAFSEVDFIPNSCFLDNKKRTMIITGPNMAGKSTYLRQTALICLMCQTGCFVPAKNANLPIIDRVFSRIGAYDDLVHSKSTFMVEMNETANILNNATEDSLVVLDEIGRGTSTFDGVSLAWAIAEYLNNKIKAKTLFATHYHHLNKMEENFEGIKNYNISVRESQEEIIFLRKIVEGGTDKSYGIQVARLAGIPKEVIESAKQTMNLIEIEDRIGDNIQKEINIRKEENLEENREKEKKAENKDLNDFIR
jgi:DNA mismatch repair protein MutS